MMFLPERSLCEKNQAIVVSKEKAYLIELKGKKIDAAVKQLEAGEQKCKKELRGYEFQYRIVCSKAKTHKLQSSSFRKFKAKYEPRLKMKENYLEETLD